MPQCTPTQLNNKEKKERIKIWDNEGLWMGTMGS
jgi:hypothetical protein